MKKIFIFSIFLFLILVDSNANNEFKIGYVITLQHDTIFGKIASTNYYDHSISCTFKNSKTNEITTYFPNQIVGYRFNDGKYYVSKEIVIDSVKTKVFMEYLINGKLDLFFRQDKKSENHYYAQKDTIGISELEFGKVIIHKDGSDWVIKNNKYVGLLSYLTYDCPDVKNDIPKMNEPDHKKLIKFAEKYQDKMCSDQACIIYEKKMPRKIKMQAYGGQSYGFYTSDDDLINSKYFSSFGFNILFQQTQRSENMYIGIGADFFSFSNNFNFARIPLSINYLNSKMGFSPMCSYEIDLKTFCLLQDLNGGFKFQMKKLSLNLTASLRTALLIRPYSLGLNFGIMYDLR